MNVLRSTASIILLAGFLAGSAAAQSGPPVQLGENAALRYWSAFAQMQDYAMATQPNSGLDDPRLKELFEKNKAALDTMYRGTTLPNCDWGIEYQLGVNTPVEYVRKAMILGKLNALYVMYLESHGDTEGAVRSVVAGLRFSQDVANGGSLFATEAAALLLMDHLPMIPNIMHAGISPAQRLALQKAVMQLGEHGLDWQSAVKRELTIHHGTDDSLSVQGLAALAQITPLYVGAMSDPSVLPRLQSMIANAPPDLRSIMPNPQRVVEAKQSLENHLAEARGLLE